MKTIKVSAPGKLHLLGEHSVVYGKPTIIASVDKRCSIEIMPRKDKIIEIISKSSKTSQKIDEKKILFDTQGAQKKWGEFIKTNDRRILKSITTDILDYPIIIIGETLLYYKNSLPSGFTLIIDSEIPMGSGMGSSASLAVSIAGALSLFLDQAFDKEKINKIAFSSEQKKHGSPSGGDNTTSCYGGLLWYRKETPELNLIQSLPFALPKSIQDNFFIFNTGIPEESTGEMVSMVKTLYQVDSPFYEKIFSNQEMLVRNLLTAIKNGEKNVIIQIIKNSERNLEKLDVVSPLAKSIIRKIEKTEGAAKICGAGGKKHATGIVLGFHTNPKKMRELILQSEEKFEYEKIRLGTEGVRREIN